MNLVIRQWSMNESRDMKLYFCINVSSLLVSDATNIACPFYDLYANVIRSTIWNYSSQQLVHQLGRILRATTLTRQLSQIQRENLSKTCSDVTFQIRTNTKRKARIHLHVLQYGLVHGIYNTVGENCRNCIFWYIRR